MEMELVPREGYEIKPLKITNLSRRRSFEAMLHDINTGEECLRLHAMKPKKILSVAF